MHYIIGLGLIAVLVGFAFGESAARTVVGIGLATFAGLFLLFVCTMLYVVHRDNAKYHVWQERTAAAGNSGPAHTYAVPLGSDECYSHNSSRVADVDGSRCTITEYAK